MEKKAIIIYNPYANNENCADALDEITKIIGHLYKHIEYLTICNINLSNVINTPDYDVFITGGDGTLNYVVNTVEDYEINKELYYYPSGTGNDFMKDVDETSKRFLTLNNYIHNLPVADIRDINNDITRLKFMNNVAYGLDGYVCEEGNRIKAKKHKPINYTAVALKGLFYDYKPTNITIDVDGRKERFENVWMAPTMNGKFFGGGMKIAPEQDRLSDEVSLVVVHDVSRPKIIKLLPTVFKGTHVKETNYVTILKGHEITATYDEPRPVQVDGEVISNVKEYQVKKLTK